MLIHPFDHHHGDKHVGSIVGEDGYLDLLAIALKLQDAVLQDAPTFDGQQGCSGALVGRWDEHLRSFAGAVRFLVSHQLDPIGILPPPVDERAIAYPHKD